MFSAVVFLVGACAVHAAIELVPQSYMKIPYNSGGSTTPFRNSAIKMALDPKDEFLYVIGKTVR